MQIFTHNIVENVFDHGFQVFSQSGSVWGLSLNEILVVVAIILIVIDFFFLSDIPTHLGYVLLCIVFARLLPLHLLYQVLFGIAIWFVLVWNHYKLWKIYIQKFINEKVAPDRFQPGVRGLIGQSGVAREIEGTMMIEIEGDLWPYECTAEVHAGDKVKVKSIVRGKPQITHLPEGI